MKSEKSPEQEATDRLKGGALTVALEWAEKVVCGFCQMPVKVEDNGTYVPHILTRIYDNASVAGTCPNSGTRIPIAHQAWQDATVEATRTLLREIRDLLVAREPSADEATR